MTLSWAISSGESAKDFLRNDFFFFPPLWFLRLLGGWPVEDGGFGVLAEVEPGPGGCRPLDESIGMDKPGERVYTVTGLANQAGRVPGVFNDSNFEAVSARGTLIAVSTKIRLSSPGSTKRQQVTWRVVQSSIKRKACGRIGATSKRRGEK